MIYILPCIHCQYILSIDASSTAVVSRMFNQAFAGGISGEATPVTIPNTEVKLICAYGTAWGTGWESRTSPAFKLNRALDLFQSTVFLLQVYEIIIL